MSCRTPNPVPLVRRHVPCDCARHFRGDGRRSKVRQSHCVTPWQIAAAARREVLGGLQCHLAGQDPYTWLERVVGRLVHLHAKDISVEQSADERGKVTGTAVGCACGDGVIDWKRIVDILRRCPRDIVMSVECGTIEQAARSIKHLTPLVAGA